MDTVAEFLTRVRNAGTAKHEKVDIPASNLRIGVASVLQKNGYIRSFKVAKDGKQGMMRVYLRYNGDGDHIIRKLESISTSGLRKYVAAGEIPVVRNGFGISVLSTNKGILSGDDARQMNVGGELLFQVW
jgi:small subunit ribosomal protein S8